MADKLSNLDLLDRCKRYILSDPTNQSLDFVIQDAIVTACREIAALDSPLAWLRGSYNEDVTRYYAKISAVTQANPGVITADSLDPDLSSDHGFQSDDIVWIEGIDGMERLNRRFYIATRASATTITLTQLDGQNAIDTTNYEAYSSGGSIYHAGIKLDDIEPASAWKLKRVYDVRFDGYPTDPMPDELINQNSAWLGCSGRPKRWMYWRRIYDDPSTPTHWLRWFGFAGQRYNLDVRFEKGYPDPSDWDESHYPPHIPEVHDYIWHRALFNLVTQTEKQKRSTRDKGDNTKIEILNANYWIAKAKEEEWKIIDLSREMIGDMPTTGGMSA
jgi:hypothetical protein